MIGIGVGERLRAYVMTDDRRGEESVALTGDWMVRTFDTYDLVLVTRFVGDVEYRVLARRDITTDDVPSVAGDEVKGPTVMFGYDDRSDRLRDLTDREVATLRWATRLCRWEEDGTSRMVVAVEMYRCKDDRCAFEVMD